MPVSTANRFGKFTSKATSDNGGCSSGLLTALPGSIAAFLRRFNRHDVFRLPRPWRCRSFSIKLRSSVGILPSEFSVRQPLVRDLPEDGAESLRVVHLFP